MDHYKLFLAVAVLFVLASIGLVLTRGFNLGIDFTGGNMLQLESPKRLKSAKCVLPWQKSATAPR